MSYLKTQTLILLLLSLVTLTSSSKAQNTDDEQLIKINTFLVNIPVIASERNGRYVSGLKKENFSIIQDGVKLDIDFFADEQAPMNVAILIDTSASTKPLIKNIESAASDFVNIFRPEDKGLIITFDSDVKLLTEFTSDKDTLKKAIWGLRSNKRGGSNMVDAIYQIVTKEFAPVKGRKAIIVLTDGAVGGRFISIEKLFEALAKSDTLVYPIIFDTESYTPKFSIPKTLTTQTGETISREEYFRILENIKKQRMLLMSSLGTVSGGRLINSNDFKQSFQSIADELKKQYLIGFYPQNVDDGQPHKFAVEVNQKDILIRTKSSIRLNVSK